MCIRVKSVVRLLCLTSTLDGIESLPSMRSVNVCSEKALQSKENVCLKPLRFRQFIWKKPFCHLIFQILHEFVHFIENPFNT